VLVGYGRTSTLDQVAGLEAQERDLRALGCEKLFLEQTSSAAPRQALQTAIDYVREDDTLVVTKLDRLARSVVHLEQIIASLEEKKVGLRILDLGIDTNTPTGRLMLNVLGSVAQFEREMMLERQREGIAKAKAEKRYKGRAPTARAKTDQIKLLAAQGFTKREIAKQLGIGERSVFRVLADGERTRSRGEHSSDASATCWFAERLEEGSRVPRPIRPALSAEPEKGGWMHDVHPRWIARG
jgi:DNA invertase Pin-like site-specific DNA recombinase